MAYCIFKIADGNGDVANPVPFADAAGVEFATRLDVIAWMREWADAHGWSALFNYEMDNDNDAADLMLANAGGALQQYAVEPA